MPEAARLYDPIGHSPTMNWLLQGAVAGLAIGLGAVVILGTGGLAAVAVVGGAVAGGAGIMEVLSTLSCVPKEVTGTITGKCSGNVFINGRPAARAHVDMTFCSKHPQVPLPIATGSGNVYINGLPAARVGDKIVCGAVITAGSGNVFIGGGSQKTDDVHPEELVPPLVHGVMLVAGIGAAVVLGGPVIAIAGLALGVAGGMAGAWAGAKLFGEGSDGQKLSTLAGGILGGMLGAKSGGILAAKLLPNPISPTVAFARAGLPGMRAAAVNAETPHAEMTVLSTTGIDEQAAHAAQMIPGLTKTQARALLEAAFNPTKPVPVVIGGSRVRSYFGKGKFRKDSDLDIGFDAKMKNKQIDNILESFDKSGNLKSERGIRIFSGNKPPSGEIKSAQEFFQRSGTREFPPERYGEPFEPSGYISFHPDGKIVVAPPGTN